jgi:hypothetical protein
MIALQRECLRAAGAEIGEVPVEISPWLALDAEELAANLRPGTKITAPTYLK